MVTDTAKGETIGDPNGGHVFQPRKGHFGHFEEPGVIYLIGEIQFKLLFHGPKWLSEWYIYLHCSHKD